MSFGERLSKSRKLKELSQSDLAKEMGFSGNTLISRFEKNQTLPNFEHLQKLQEILNVDLHWLITGQQYDPNTRLVKQFQATYEGLLKEHNAAEKVVEDLEAQKAAGKKLTHDQEQQLLQNRGIVRSRLRQMQQFLEQQQDEKDAAL